MNAPTSSRRPSGLPRALADLILVVALQAVLTIAHFSYGAHRYDDPSRYHVVVPAIVAFALMGAATAFAFFRPNRLTRWLLCAVASIPFVGMFGLYHGLVLHGAKLLWFAAGASPARLLELFDSPDFAVPNDLLFELSGLSTFFVALAVVWSLVRLMRIAPRAGDSTEPTPESGSDAAQPS